MIKRRSFQGLIMEIVKNIAEEKLTDADCISIAEEHADDLNTLLTAKIIPQVISFLQLLHSVRPSKQYQMALMDAESIQIHLADLKENGPKTPFVEVPVEQSETNEEPEFYRQVDSLGAKKVPNPWHKVQQEYRVLSEEKEKIEVSEGNDESPLFT